MTARGITLERKDIIKMKLKDIMYVDVDLSHLALDKEQCVFVNTVLKLRVPIRTRNLLSV